jgi:hypothetical protein
MGKNGQINPYAGILTMEQAYIQAIFLFYIDMKAVLQINLTGEGNFIWSFKKAVVRSMREKRKMPQR